MNISGTWKGEYRYELDDPALIVDPISFTVQMRQSALGGLRGTGEDDPPGPPASCQFRGRIKGSHVFFRKIPDRFYTMGKDGFRSIEEYVAEVFGESVRGYPPPPQIHYHGEISLLGHRVEGVWHIPSYLLMLKDARRHLRFEETRGTWWMERAAADSFGEK